MPVFSTLFLNSLIGKSVLKNNGIVKAIVCPNASNYSRKTIDELTENNVKNRNEAIIFLYFIESPFYVN